MLTSKRKEKISAFLDNDMHRDELMSFSLSAEPDDALAAQRYQIIGEAMRGEMSDSSFIDVSSAVREALADENIAAHMPTQVAADTGSSSTAKTGAAEASSWGLSAWFRPVAGIAMAATVAVVMVISLSEQDTGGILPASGPVANNVDKQPVVQPAVQLAKENKVPEATIALDKKATNIDPHVDQRLVNQHLEFATQDALQGRMPYVRAVSYENQK